MIRFRLPWPPSLNSYYRTYRGRILISAEGRAYRQEVCLMGLPMAPEGRLAVSIVLHSPRAGRFDVDNYLKVTLDSMKHAGVFEDDWLIDELHVRRGKAAKPGRLDVLIKSFDPGSTVALDSMGDW